MKIKIINSYCKDTWYRNSIGKVFEVKEIKEKVAYVKKGDQERSYAVAKNDYEIIAR